MPQVILTVTQANCRCGYHRQGERFVVGELCPPLLIINEIPEKLRVSDRQILTEAIIEGKRAEQEGRYYHPAANGKIDEMTNGYSSEIQLASLLDNARLAGQIESSR